MVRLDRVDDVRSRVSGVTVDTMLYATADVATDRASVASLNALDRVADAVGDLRTAGFLGPDAGVERAVLTPDFHRGAKLPVGLALALSGTVLPAAIGNDIGCGMSFAVLHGADAAEIAERWSEIAPRLRHAFFEGGRTIEADAAQRRQILARGLVAAERSIVRGVWEDAPADVGAGLAGRIHDPFGTVEPESPFEEWIAPGGREGPVRDQLLGTIGGGNHFVELQEVQSVRDRHAAWAWGLRRGAVGVMVHSGSVGLGRAVATVHAGRALARWPKGMRRPADWLVPLPTTGPNADLGLAYLADMVAAARFAAANRLFLSLMVRRVLSDVLGRPVGWRLVHDLPHNAIWADAEGTVLHRKGSCPALAGSGEGPFACGVPVIVPGSMGTASALLKGTGDRECLESAPHGAGRALSRNAARARQDAAVPRVVTPVDMERARGDVRKEAERRLAEEAPRAYKAIEPAIDTMERGGMATEVARLAPLATIKG
jgi:tRNA-splicing ligase RtcB